MIEKLQTDYAVRHTKKQKDAFIEYIAREFPCVVEEKHSAKNIFIGDIASSSHIACAHYDTAKKNLINVKLYFDKSRRNNFKRSFLSFINGLGAIKQNPCNSNDNTSGILCAIELYKTCNIPVILFDNEEGGYGGSYMFYKKHKEYRDKVYINIDSIGVGDSFAIIYNKGCRELATQMLGGFDGDITAEETNGSRYLSDSDFLKTAVTIAAFKRDEKGNRYVDDIHTPNDIKLDIKNIKKVVAMVSGFLSSRSI